MNAILKLARPRIGQLVSGIAEQHASQRMLFNSARLNRDEFNSLWSKDDLKFLCYVFARREKSRSQIMQDLWVCFELGEKRDGFFVEFGATNGLKNSNTWLLEKEYGWNGILAEPNPFWHRDLAANRSAAIEHKCVSSKSNEMVAFTVTDDSDPELSGIASFSAGEHFAAQREQGSTISVETISLDELLDKYRAPSVVDYMSIDTEGSEFDILSNLDFGKRQFKLISIEVNQVTERLQDKLLADNGYVRVFSHLSQWDAWYVSAELRKKAKPEIFAPTA